MTSKDKYRQSHKRLFLILQLKEIKAKIAMLESRYAEADLLKSELNYLMRSIEITLDRLEWSKDNKPDYLDDFKD